MNSRFFTLGLVILLVATVSPALTLGADDDPAAARWPVQPLAEVARHQAPVLDRAALDREDHERLEQGLPDRFALVQGVSLTPDDTGSWETLPNGHSLWRLRIGCRDVLSLNLGFERFWLPAGARLLVYPASAAGEVQVYDESDNADHGQLWTPVVLADEVVVELEVDPALRWQVELELTSIGRGYRFFGEDALDKSGSCNIDVVCPQGDDWRDEIDAVGGYSYGGALFCTGFMVNNTALDAKPLFMTAYHCNVRAHLAPSVVVYWNFQSPDCGLQTSGPLDDNQTGAVLRAEYSTTDVSLLELDEVPDPAFGVKYAGWNRGSDEPSSAVCIHHPSGDEKSISFENDPLAVTSYQGNASPGDGTHIRVFDWDEGTTERGSSGSPLFDQDHYVVGQLHGGGAACGNSLPDWYGRFNLSWTGGGASDSRLSDWLDPLGTGVLTLRGYDPVKPQFVVTPDTGFEPSGSYGGPFSPDETIYTLTNTGTVVADFTAQVADPWLTVNPAAGQIPVGGSVDVTVALASSAADMEVGSHVSALQIYNPDIGGVPTTIRQVILTVDPSGSELEVQPEADFRSSGIAGGPFDPVEMVYTIANIGDETANFTASAQGSWLLVSPGSGSIPVAGSVDVTVSLTPDAASLGVGSHRSVLAITNEGQGAGSTERAVTLVVMSTAPALLGAAPNPFGGLSYSYTRVLFTLPVAATVSAKIHDLRGGLVKDLGSKPFEAGLRHFIWDGTGPGGSRAASGPYVFTLHAPGGDQKTSIMLIH